MGQLCCFGFSRSALAAIACSLLAVGGVAAESETRTASVDEPTGALHLSDARALALSRSPALGARQSQAAAAVQRTRQAGLFPNPEVGVEIENFAGSGAFDGFDAAETTFVLSQPVQLGGKRGKRRDVASLDEDRIRSEYDAAELNLLREVDSAFAALLATQERLSIANNLVDLAKDTLESISSQVRAGGALPTDRIRAEVNVDSALLDRERLRSALATARLRLARTWGSANPTFDEVRGELREIGPPPPLVGLLEHLEETPEVARWDAEVSRQRAQVRLEEARAYPDVRLAVGVRRLSETDDYAAVVGLTVPIPVFDRNQGNAAAASELLHTAEERARENRIRIESLLATTHQRLLSEYETATRLQDVLIPKAKEAFTGTQRSLRSGRLRYTDVLEAQRTLFSLELNYIDALAAYHVAFAELEQLAGRRLAPDRDSLPENHR
ncbi:MAG TPA: TolC family protein [Dehalococcoidia bacterium]